MKVVTAQQMAQIDTYAINNLGIPSIHLMETAGKKIAHYAHRFLNKVKASKKRVVFFAWKGNNGGDALVAARHLHTMDLTVEIKVIFLAPIDKLKGDALLNYTRLLEIYPDSILHAETLDLLLDTKEFVAKANLIVDGIFGTGFLGEPSGHTAEAIYFINNLHKPVISIDIPSGVNGTTGKAMLAVKAHTTITIGLPKHGLLFGDGPEYTGKIIIANIGFPKEAIESVESKLYYLTNKYIKKLLPLRMENSHKMTFGHLFILGGSSGLTGAVLLAAKAALRSGCGLVTIGCPESINPILETALIEAITFPLPETVKKTINPHSLNQLFSIMADRKCTAVVIGPGLGKHPDTTKFVEKFIMQCPYPMVIDADALNAISMTDTKILNKAHIPPVITPHPGEFSRLIKKTTKEIKSHRLTYIEHFTQQHNTAIVLKGKNTLITAKDSPRFINPTGNNGLATAGSGDVLAGILGTFLAQRLSPIDAACCAVYCHGMAADYAVKRLGTRSLIASDVIQYLPKVFQSKM